MRATSLILLALLLTGCASAPMSADARGTSGELFTPNPD